MSDVTRKDFHIKTEDDVSIAIREVRTASGNTRAPIIMLHGTRIPSLSEFDLDVPNGSLAQDMAERGHVVYLLDARGFGRSERPKAMDKPPVSGANALVRTIEMTRDLHAATKHLKANTGWDKVSIFGWGAGGTCAAMYASLWPEYISHIMLYCMPYGAVGDSPTFTIGSKWDDPENPGHFNRKDFGNYQCNTLELLDHHWNTGIPIEDKDAWRDPAMLDAFRQALLDGDPTSMERNPPSYRSPNGMLEDLYIMGCNGRRLFDASQVYCRVMIIRGETDVLSRDSDMQELIKELVHAEEVVYHNPTNTTHYILLDRPERGKNDLLKRMDEFLSTGVAPA